jgi:SPX domain protein involved in polyphosphate accumulation
MKFGEHLRKQRLPQWRFFYLDFDGLKFTLKEATIAEWSEKEDQLFVDRLVIELDKVHSFHALKQGETQRRIRSCQRRIQTLSASQHPALSEYLSIQNEITDITSEVQELFWYTRLNYAGFIKIVKKHDRYASNASPLREKFLTYLHDRPFYRSEVFSQLTAELAKLYDSARINGSNPFNNFASITPPSVITPIARQHEPIVYKTTKYWVHPDNIMDVKTHLLKYMPLISQTASPSIQSLLNNSTPSSFGTDADTMLNYAIGGFHSDEMISSVYLDDQSFSYYMSRIQFLSQPRCIRLRWYGTDNRNVHVERKAYGYGVSDAVEGLPTTQDEESSTKDRHPLKAKSVPEWLCGDWDASGKLFKAYQKRKSSGYDWLSDDCEQKEAERLQKVAKEIQNTVVEEQLRPVVRTVFRRTVFQSPDESIRISIDTDLVMAREYGWKQPDAPVGESWRRDDLTAATATEDYYLDIPADPAAGADDFHRFPYAIVEVKLRSNHSICSSSIQSEFEEPDCINNLVRAQMMEPVTHFSKYVHAVSVLWESKVPLLPFWVRVFISHPGDAIECTFISSY